MLNIEEINSILTMLNLKIKRTITGDYEITDYNLNTTERLKNTNGFYEYSFINDETNYTLFISESFIKLTNDLREVFTIKKNYFEYYQKKDKSNNNRSRVIIAPNELSFYLSEDSIPIPINDQYTIKTNPYTLAIIDALNKTSEDLGIHGIIRRNTTIAFDRDNIPTRTDIKRHFNKDGHLIKGSTTPTQIENDFYEYVIEDMATHDYILKLIDRLESVFPGITIKLVAINNNLGLILEKMDRKILNHQNT